MNWYYEQAGQRQGPVTDSELDNLITQGLVSQTTLVWCEGMANWAPLAQARPTAADAATLGEPPAEGWIRCTATGRYFPPSEIVYIDGKPYSAAAKPAVMRGIMESGSVPTGVDTGRTGPPWEDRGRLGAFKAAKETLAGVLLHPDLTFSKINRDRGLGAPLLYLVILGSISGLFSVAYNAIFNLGFESMLPSELHRPQQSLPFTAGMTVGILVFSAVLLPVFLAIGAFIGSGILHLSLMICGGAKQPFETTFRTYCYSHGSVTLFQLVPFCGSLIGLVWGIVCACIGTAKMHEIGTGRAVLAVLLPVGVCCTALGLIFGAAIAAGISAAGHH